MDSLLRCEDNRAMASCSHQNDGPARSGALPPIAIVLAAVAMIAAGARSFTRAVPLEKSAEYTANVSLGDVDGDGKLDMVLAKGRHGPQRDVVLLGDGKGHFKPGATLPNAPDRSYSAPLADLDGD